MSFLLDHPELLRSFKKGEATALAEVYRLYLPLVAGIVRHGFSFEGGGKNYRYTGAASAFEADDLISEIFLRAFSPGARHAYDGLRPYFQYLKTIARNVILDRLRPASPRSGATEISPGRESWVGRTIPTQS